MERVHSPKIKVQNETCLVKIVRDQIVTRIYQYLLGYKNQLFELLNAESNSLSFLWPFSNKAAALWKAVVILRSC